MVLVLLAYALAGIPAQIQNPPARLAAFLRDGVSLDSAEMMAVRRGETVAKVLDAELTREIAVFGVAAVDLTREEYVRRVLDFGDSARAPSRRRLGIFGDPAILQDVRDVTIIQRDVDELKNCRPGDCVMKMPAAAMTRLHEEIDWSAASAQAQVTALAQQGLVEYVADYRTRGNAALVVYDDRGNVRASQAFDDLLAATPHVYQYVPDLHRYLTEYPSARLANAHEVLFWSEDVIPRLRPVLSVTHLVVYAPPDHPDLTLVAAKQIYANHYFEAAFELTCFVAAGPDAAAGGYLVVLRRFRFDRLPSGGPINIRGRAIDALRQQLVADLQRYQNR